MIECQVQTHTMLAPCARREGHPGPHLTQAQRNYLQGDETFPVDYDDPEKSPYNIGIPGFAFLICNMEHPERPGLRCDQAWLEGTCTHYQRHACHKFTLTWR